MNVPGNSSQLSGGMPEYIADPNIRIQKWGGALRTNAFDIETSLRNGDHRLIGPHGQSGKDEYQKYMPSSQPIQYATNTSLTVDRVQELDPAWNLRGVDNQRWDIPMFDPRKKSNHNISFQTMVDTRSDVKDSYTACKNVGSYGFTG
jgi:hypothetical protein